MSKFLFLASFHVWKETYKVMSQEFSWLFIQCVETDDKSFQLVLGSRTRATGITQHVSVLNNFILNYPYVWDVYSCVLRCHVPFWENNSALLSLGMFITLPDANLPSATFSACNLFYSLLRKHRKCINSFCKKMIQADEYTTWATLSRDNFILLVY